MTGMAQSTSQRGNHPIRGISRFMTGSHSEETHTLAVANPEFYAWISGGEGHRTFSSLQYTHDPRDPRPATCAASCKLQLSTAQCSYAPEFHPAPVPGWGPMKPWRDALASGVCSTVASWCKGGAERERVARRVSIRYSMTVHCSGRMAGTGYFGRVAGIRV
jgi:hypothetical protein